jgi:hypothetical protein
MCLSRISHTAKFPDTQIRMNRNVRWELYGLADKKRLRHNDAPCRANNPPIRFVC